MQKKGRGKEASGPRAEGQPTEAAKAEPLATRNTNARQSWTASERGPIPSREATEKANDLKHQAKAKRPSKATGTGRANPGRTPGTRTASDTRASQSRANAWNRNALRRDGQTHRSETKNRDQDGAEKQGGNITQ